MASTPAQTLTHLGVEYGMSFYESSLENSADGSIIHEALVERGLSPDSERSQLFSLYSPDSRKSIAVSVTPYNTEDQSMEAGLSISEGGHAQAVIVYLVNRIRIERFSTLAVNEEGQLVTAEFSTEALMNSKARGLVEQFGRVRTARPLIEITRRQARSMGSLTFNSLLVDPKSRTVHNEDEIKALRANSQIIAEISQFVLMRTQGSACCSCSCSCWGSSSCSCSYAG